MGSFWPLGKSALGIIEDVGSYCEVVGESLCGTCSLESPGPLGGVCVSCGPSEREGSPSTWASRGTWDSCALRGGSSQLSGGLPFYPGHDPETLTSAQYSLCVS